MDMRRYGFFRRMALLLFCVGISVSSSAREKLRAYMPSSPNGTAVIVCPGGSYFWHDFRYEGDSVATWLARNGIAAFVLNYRTAGGFAFASRSRLLFPGAEHPEMLGDVQDAIVYLRRNADSLGINPDRIGVMGFSAGGHLALMSAAFYKWGYGEMASVPAERKPDFIAPVYPVVTMSADCVHRRSRRGLLGEYRKGNKAFQDSLSMEKHAKDIACPVFLLNCEDDDVVDYRNSVLMDSALTAARVPHLYTRYKRGGHGFGYHPEAFSEETKLWPEVFINWLRQLN